MDVRMCWGLVVVLGASVSSLHAQTAIYRCIENGVATFTDRPCSADAAPIEVDTARVSTFTPVPASKVDVPKTQRAKTRRAVGVDRTKAKDRCVSIRSALRKIEDQYRSGYSAKQGVRLDERKRDLRQQAKELRC